MISSLVIVFPFSPIIFHLGPIAIRWYGLGYAVAFLAGLWLAGRYLNRKGVLERQWGDLAFWSIVLGLIAARLYYDFQSGAGYYLTHLQDVFAFWQGGMAYFGAVFTVPVFVLVYCIWRRLPFWIVVDGAALFAAIGQPIGRIGNIFNGDILGYASNLPWAIRYTSPETFAPTTTTAYQPANAYELLLGLVILGIVLAVRRWVRPRDGALFSVCQPLCRPQLLHLLPAGQLGHAVRAEAGAAFLDRARHRAGRRVLRLAALAGDGAPPPDVSPTDGSDEGEATEKAAESGDATAAPTSRRPPASLQGSISG